MTTTMEKPRSKYRGANHEKSDAPRSSYSRRLARIRNDAAEEALDRLHAARRSVRNVRRRISDSEDAVALEVRRRPLRALGFAFALGVTAAVVVGALVRNVTRGDGALLDD